MDDIKRNRGRPTSGHRKVKRHGIRMSDEEDAILKYLSEKEGKTRTEVLMEALKLKYEMTVQQEADDSDDGYYDDDYYDWDDDDEEYSDFE